MHCKNRIGARPTKGANPDLQTLSPMTALLKVRAVLPHNPFLLHPSKFEKVSLSARQLGDS